MQLTIETIMRYFILFSLILLGYSSIAQCVDSLFLGNDTTICQGQNVTLSVPPGYTSVLWSNGNNSNSITAQTTGNYWVNAKLNQNNNLVINGNFSAGNTGFTSAYTLGTGGSYGLLSNEGTYAISTNASLTHNNFAACTDHTTGTGNFMIVNGSSQVNQVIWSQTITVQPYTYYNFSAWFTSVIASNPAILSFKVNSTVLGSNINVSSTVCNWQNFTQVWYSGTTTSASISILNQNTATSGNDFAIDDIRFSPYCFFRDTIHIEVIPNPIVNLGTNAQLCQGQSLTLDAGNPGLDYLWQDGSTQSTFSTNTGGTYWVAVTDSICTTTDSIDVTVNPVANPDLGPDTMICEGSQITLNPGPGQLYIWNNNTFDPQLTVNQGGTYSVTVYLSINNPCVGIDSLEVTLVSQPHFGSDTCLRENELPYPLQATQLPNMDYLWSNGATTNSINVNESGIYSLTVNPLGKPSWKCSDEVEVLALPAGSFIYSQLLNPDLTFLKDLGFGDQSMCNHQAMKNLGPIVPSNMNIVYQWYEDGAPVSNLSNYIFAQKTPANYTLKLELGNLCSDEIQVEVISCELDIPNVITPNGDLSNEMFYIKNLPESFPNSTLIIYNRWGAKVYSTENYQNDWTGADQSDGVYYYVLILNDGLETTYRGTLTILRN